MTVIKDEIEKEVRFPSDSTASQEKDILVKMVNGIINKNFNHEIDISGFIKKGDGKPIFKRI